MNNITIYLNTGLLSYMKCPLSLIVTLTLHALSTAGNCEICQRSVNFCCHLAFYQYLLSVSTVCLFHPQALNKKEHRGCDSPDADASYVLTPNTEEKYKKINEEFDNMMKSHKIVS